MISEKVLEKVDIIFIRFIFSVVINVYINICCLIRF